MSIVEEGAASVDPGLVRWTGYGLAALGLGLGFLDLFRPDTLTAAALLAVPPIVLALALYMPTTFEVANRRGSGRGLNPLLGAPLLGLFIVAVEQDLIDPDWLMIPAAIFAAVSLALGFTAVKRPGLAGPMTLLVFTAIFGGLYGYSAVRLADVQFDPSAGSVIQAPVLSKYETHGKSTGYHLRLGPWGPTTAPSSVQVSSSTYAALNEGDNVCMTLHPGALTLPWFKLGLCTSPNGAG
ncbi:MAG: hypothetical protein ACHP7N_18325 [Caulobacterales bacterium]